MDTTSVVDVAAAVEEELERLKVARPALSSRIERAEDILVTHLSCPKAGIVRPRIRGGELVAYLVKGSGGTVYRVDPASWQCSCPDAHRRGKGCKHAILTWALWRAYRPAPAPTHIGHRRCAAKPKIVRHEAVADGGLEHAGAVALRELEGLASSYEERECPRCFEGLVYDGRAGEWVACERCSGTGRARAFVYEHARRGEDSGHASSIARKSVVCSCCGQRVLSRFTTEVTEDEGLLSWFVGAHDVADCIRAGYWA